MLCYEWLHMGGSNTEFYVDLCNWLAVPQQHQALRKGCGSWSALFISVTFLHKSSTVCHHPFGTFSDPKQAGIEHQWQIALYWRAHFCQELAK